MSEDLLGRIGGKERKSISRKKGIIRKEKLYVLKFDIYTLELTRCLVTLLLGIDLSVFTLRA